MLHPDCTALRLSQAEYFNQSPTRSSQARVPAGQQVSLGVVYTQGARINHQYLADYNAQAGTGFGQSLLIQPIHDAYVATSQPGLANAAIMRSLQAQFGRVTVYESPQALKAARPDVIAMVDTRSQLITPRASDVQSDVTVQFYDRDMHYIATAQGHDQKSFRPVWAGARTTDEYVSEIRQQQDVQVSALQRFDVALRSVVK
ncbi:MAG: ATPase [Pseudomonas sp.]|nr:ATPase [Pseudomonas sp.]